MGGRRFSITDADLTYLGSGPMTDGHAIVVALGCLIPTVLRPDGRSVGYYYVREDYVHGFRHDEADEPWEEAKEEVRALHPPLKKPFQA